MIISTFCCDDFPFVPVSVIFVKIICGFYFFIIPSLPAFCSLCQIVGYVFKEPSVSELVGHCPDDLLINSTLGKKPSTTKTQLKTIFFNHCVFIIEHTLQM